MRLKFLLLFLMGFFHAFSQQIDNGYAPVISDFSNILTSGVYGGVNPNGKVPDDSHPWQHLLVIRHANTQNNYQLQLASAYSVNDRIFFRKIAGELAPIHTDWIELATRGSNTFWGNQTFMGNIGIGNTSPNQKLDVSGIVRSTHTEFYEGNNWCGFIGRGGSYTGGWSSIPDALTLSYAGRDFAIGGWGTDGIWRGCSLFINANNGNIGVGTTTPGNYRLNVSGKIRADEIVVNTTGADFVFEPGYKLRTLSELETFIRTNKHLPDIAPAKEMQHNGVRAGEMQAKLLQKVEELTLYVIEQQKMIELQNQRIKQLEQRLNQ